jgi:hypothetical protein
MVTIKPTLPAQRARFSSSRLPPAAFAAENDSMRDSSFSDHVLPMEKLPSGFSRPLCMRTMPELRTAMTMMRAFLPSGGESGGGGEDGCDASSVTRTWVMYDSNTFWNGRVLLPSKN